MAGSASYGGVLLENPSLLAKPIVLLLLAGTVAPAAAMAAAYLATGSRGLLLALALAAAPLPLDLLIIYGAVKPAVERVAGFARLMVSRGNVVSYGVIGRVNGSLVVSARLSSGDLLLAALDTKAAKLVLVRSPTIVGELGGIPRVGRAYRVDWPIKPKPALFDCSMWAGKLKGPIIMPHPEKPVLVSVEGDAVGGYVICPGLFEDKLLELLAAIGL